MYAVKREQEASGAALLDLAVTNPTACGLGEWGEAIAVALSKPGSAQYRPFPQGSPEARAAVAGYYARLGAHVDPEDLLLTASTSESYSLLFQLLCDAGDEVLVPTPSYPLFEHLAGLATVTARTYALRYAGEWQVDFQSLEESLGNRSRALVVVNPNNPTGQYLRQAEAIRLMELCAQRGLALIADEVFWEYALGDANERAWLAGITDSPALCVSLGGLSKSAGMPQMKVGWMVLRGPGEERARALSRLLWIADTYLSVSAPVQEALADLLTIGLDVQERIQQRLRENLRMVREWSKTVSLLSLLPAEGGWSVILRLPAHLNEEQWCERLLRDAGVWLQPGYFYDLQGGPFVVLSLLTPPEVLADALTRIAPLIEDAARED